MEIVWDRCDREDWQAEEMPLQQSWAYGAVLSGLGAEVRRAGITTASGARGLAQFVARRAGPLRLSLLSQGPLWIDRPAPGDQVAALRRLGRAAFPLVCTTAVRRAGLPLARQREHAVVDLAGEPAQLRAGLSGKWRNRLVRAEAEAFAFSIGRPGPAAVARLLNTDAAQQRARGYRALPARFTHGWLAYDPDAAILAEARHRGQCVAAMLFLLHAPWASYHIGWSGPVGRTLNAHNSLLWQAMLWLRGEGFSALDLGDVDRTGAPGLARFKLGAGAHVVPLGATVLVLPWP